MSEPTKLPLRITSRETTYTCPFMNITHQQAQFDGFAKDYYVVEFGRRGGVVAVRDGRLLLARQYRFLLNGCSWELPGGTIGNDENLEAGLARECLEETGVQVSNLRQLLVYYPGLDNVDNKTTVFYTHEAESARAFVPDPTEVDAIDWVPLERCVNMVFRQQILDAMSVAGILGYQHLLRDGRDDAPPKGDG